MSLQINQIYPCLRPFYYRSQVCLYVHPCVLLKLMRRNCIQTRYYVKPVTVLDVCSILAIPEDWESIQDTVDHKTVMTCMLYHPKTMSFTEERGIKLKIQDSFPNIRENRLHAWVCVNFFKLVFNHLRGYMDMRVVGRTFQGELLVRLYTKDFERVKRLGLVYLIKEGSDLRGLTQYREYTSLVNYQISTFGQVCVNDIMNLYSQHVIKEGSTCAIEIED
jgi:hypothetical protein